MLLEQYVVTVTAAYNGEAVFGCFDLRDAAKQLLWARRD